MTETSDPKIDKEQESDPLTSAGATTTTAATVVVVDGEDPTGAPHGKWRNGLCSCCEVLCKCTFWMALCCHTPSVAQLMTRMNLDYSGNEAKPAAVRRTLLAVFFLSAALSIISYGLAALVYLVYILSRVRFHMRKRYGIGGTTACNAIGDFCMSFWCGCCAIIQMNRHTHHENVYPYDALAPDGLDIEAPKIPNPYAVSTGPTKAQEVI
eukprot:CAMPEP_0116834858 /NCGR_PEP_ID=MMETSP0418-20121206/7220_1 /TAXON_ID=1158023 /ORGANISM="Astrosyne radiata, Strain 13vi08-1A" /LENGTH=209 /DNA_ID=CAMNT_0004464455 /DNA_START=30 /DNA_END=659 /DNA_ORIENTATION=+